MHICAYLDRNVIDIERSGKYLRYEYIPSAHAVYLLMRKNNDRTVERTCEVGASLVPVNIVAFGTAINLKKKKSNFWSTTIYTKMKNNMAGTPNTFMRGR